MWHDMLIAVSCFFAGFGFASVLNMARDERRKKNWTSYTEDLKRSRKND